MSEYRNEYRGSRGGNSRNSGRPGTDNRNNRQEAYRNDRDYNPEYYEYEDEDYDDYYEEDYYESDYESDYEDDYEDDYDNYDDYEDDYEEPDRGRTARSSYDDREWEYRNRRRDANVGYRRPNNRAGQNRATSGNRYSRSNTADRRSTPAGKGEASDRRNSAPKRAGNPKQKKSQKNKIILLIFEIIVLLVLVAVFWLFRTTSKMQRIDIQEDDIVINEMAVTNESMKGYHNIALFGVDARDKSLGKGNRTDTIIICSINEDTGEIKLCSVYRDTYLNLGNDSYNKCNAAYAKGGPEQAINMLNMNLDMNITDYVTVGFTGLIDVIDALGGIYLDITEPEIPHLNNYQISMVGKTTDKEHYYAEEGKDYIAVNQPGKQKLNGLQATAYCRIRYVGDDFQRSQRQRTVLQEIMNVAKSASPITLNSILQKVMPNVSTSLSIDEMTGMLSMIAKYTVVADDGFPFESNRATGKVGSKGSCVIPNNLEQNVILLQEFLFNNKDYIPSEEVKRYSSKISSDTGY